MALYIPPELTDVIIGFIMDRKTLYNCCLVSTQWLPASRQQLFRAIDLDSAERCTLFIARVLHDESQRPYLRLVRSLDLSEGPSLSTKAPRLGRAAILFSLAGQLPALVELTIRAKAWGNDHAFLTEPLLFSQFSSLHKLVLMVCSFPSFAYVRRVITALPRLRDLRWRLVRSCLGHAVFQPTPRPVLHCLSLTFSSEGDIDDLVTWLLYTPSCSSIRHLSFHPIPPGDEGLPGYDFTSSQHTFFSAVGPHVTTLELQSHVDCSLERFTTLRELTFSFGFDARTRYSLGLKLALRVLSTCGSRLHVLRFRGLYVHRTKPQAKSALDRSQDGGSPRPPYTFNAMYPEDDGQ